MQHAQVVVLSDFTIFVPTLPDRAHSQLAAQAPSNIGDLLNLSTKKQMQIALEDCDLSILEKANTPTKRILWDSYHGYDHGK
jgi:hypothetical protein